MGFTKPKMPAPPDPYAVADAQNRQNLYASMVNLAGNRIEQNTPYGSVSFDNNGFWRVDDKGKMTQVAEAGDDGAAYIPNQIQNVKLSDGQQRLLDAQEAGQIANVDLSNKMLGGIEKTFSQDPKEIFNNLPERVGGITSALQAPKTSYGYQDLNTNNLSAMPQAEKMRFNAASDYSDDRRRVEDAFMSRMNEDLERDRSALEQRLANQGIVAGSEAYDNAMALHGRNVNDARTQAILAGGQEQSRMYGLEADQFGRNLAAQGQEFNQGMAGRQQGFSETSIVNDVYNRNRRDQGNFYNNALASALAQKVQAGNFDNTNRQNALSENMMMRNLPLSEFNALRSGVNVQTPSFTPFYQMGVAPSDITGNIYTSYQQQVNNANAAQAAQNEFAGNLRQAGMGIGMMASDIRVKQDIEWVGQTVGGYNLYQFAYRDNPDQKHVGVMAQEVELINPDAVKEINGVKHVDYRKIH